MNKFKKTLLTAATVALGAAMSVSVAQAISIPLTGSVAFNGGSYTPQNSAGVKVPLNTATQIDFTSNTLTVTGSSGAIAAAGIVSGTTGTIKDFSFSPLVVGNPFFTIGGLTFGIQSLNVNFQSNNALVLSGSGIFNLSGYTSTPGTWDFTGNASGSSLSWSGGAAVPEPGTLLLLGSGLAGLGLWRTKKAKA